MTAEELHFSVYKYPLIVADEQIVQLPKGARVLLIAEQPDHEGKAALRMWAHIDRRQPLVSRKIIMYGTGYEMPAEPGKFLGTVLTRHGALVWHVYDCGEMPHPAC